MAWPEMEIGDSLRDTSVNHDSQPMGKKNLCVWNQTLTCVRFSKFNMKWNLANRTAWSQFVKPLGWELHSQILTKFDKAEPGHGS